MRVGVLEHVERLVRLDGKFEVGAVPFVRDGDGQLICGLMPEEHHVEAVVLSVGEFSIRSCVALVLAMVAPSVIDTSVARCGV
jgi:hypothetical protein